MFDTCFSRFGAEVSDIRATNRNRLGELGGKLQQYLYFKDLRTKYNFKTSRLDNGDTVMTTSCCQTRFKDMLSGWDYENMHNATVVHLSIHIQHAKYLQSGIRNYSLLFPNKLIFLTVQLFLLSLPRFSHFGDFPSLHSYLFHHAHFTSIQLLPRLSKLFPSRVLTPSLIGHWASILLSPGARFLFVLARGATCPERPTAWSLPAVSTWHSLAWGAGLHLQRPESGRWHTQPCVCARQTHKCSCKSCHLPSTTTGHKVMWCKMINELVLTDVIIKCVPSTRQCVCVDSDYRWTKVPFGNLLLFQINRKETRKAGWGGKTK